MTVLVVGESLVDGIVSTDGEDTFSAGGAPFNVAIGLGRLNVPTEFATQLADDSFGAMIQDKLSQSDVRTLLLDPIPARTSSSTATVGADGSASYQFAVTWDAVEFPNPARFEAVHVGSLATFIEPGASRVAEFVARAALQGVPVTFDPNVRTAVSEEPLSWSSAFDRIWSCTTILKLSDEDSAVLFPGENLRSVAERLAADHGVVAITQGSAGAIVATRNHLVEVPTHPVDVVDTIGAGDSFMAAMIAWCSAGGWVSPASLEKRDLIALAETGVSAASLTCTRVGADPPNRSELEA